MLLVGFVDVQDFSVVCGHALGYFAVIVSEISRAVNLSCELGGGVSSANE